MRTDLFSNLCILLEFLCAIWHFCISSGEWYIHDGFMSFVTGKKKYYENGPVFQICVFARVLYAKLGISVVTQESGTFVMNLCHS